MQIISVGLASAPLQQLTYMDVPSLFTVHFPNKRGLLAG